MSALNFQRPIDRPALVNSVLGRVFGVSRNGFLRAGQSLAELDGGEWSRILGTFRRNAKPVSGPHAGRMGFDASAQTSVVDVGNPVLATLMQEVRAVRFALSPVLSVVRGQDCFDGACAADVAALGDMIVVALGSLERAISDAAPIDDLQSEIAAAAKLIKKLGACLQHGTPDGETAKLGLRSAKARLKALAALLRKRWLAAPVAESLQAVEQCGRCIEEGIADVNETAHEVGLSDCDMDRCLSASTQASLASILAGLARGWALITQLAGLDGGSVLREIRRAAADVAGRMESQLLGIDPVRLAQEFGLADEDAQRLHRMLARLHQRAQRCAIDLQRIGGPDPLMDSPNLPGAEAQPRVATPRMAREPVFPVGASSKRSARKAPHAAGGIDPALASTPPSADVEPMQDEDTD